MALKGTLGEMFSHQNYLLWVITPNTDILPYISTVYNRPFSSFSRSFEYPRESSPGTPRVDAGRLSEKKHWCSDAEYAILLVQHAVSIL